MAHWMQQQRIQLILTGAPNERDINQTFITELQSRINEVNQVFDFAGQTDMLTLPALIDACQIFVSTDSGPYHMAVALKKPTLCWLTYNETTSFHFHPWVRCLVNPDEAAFMTAVRALSAS